jgi:hypothetical protein
LLQLGVLAVLLLQTPWQHKALCSTQWACNTFPLGLKGAFAPFFLDVKFTN